VAEDDEFHAAPDFLFLDPAEHGDWDELIKHIEEGGKITDKMRRFIVGVFRKEIKLPSNRPPKRKTSLRRALVAAYVRNQETQGLGRTAAVKQVAIRFDVDERIVWKALQEHARALDAKYAKAAKARPTDNK
jgi:hypothetical protein